MKITISGKKIMKAIALFFFAVALGSVSVVNNTNIVEAKGKMVTITPQQEREYGEQNFAKEKAQYHLRETSADSPLRKIQDELVAYNSDRLNYDDGKHDRWLAPIGLADDTYPHEGCSCAGYTYVRQENEDRLNNDCHDYDIIQYSHTAALLAHEFGHFVNKDSLSWVKGYPKSAQRDDEHEADQAGMELLDRVPEYSMTSMADSTNGFQGIYPTAADDVKFIEDWSYGRLKFFRSDNDRYYITFTVDGVLFDPPEGDDYDFTTYGGYRRIFYLAGQIASCIHHGIWKKENIGHAPESYFFPDGRDDKTVLAVWADSSCVGKPAKILATFHIDTKKPKENRDRFERCEANSLN